MNMLTYGNSAKALQQNGYVPAACSETGPIGPWPVRQHDYSRFPENNPLPVAVLTSIPLPRFEGDPVQSPMDTWLATVTVKVRAELATEAAAIVAKYVGAAVCPVRVDNGALVYVFSLSGPQFPLVETAPWDDATDSVAVHTGPAYIPLNSTWRGPDLLDVPRPALPEIDQQKAHALIKDFDALLEARAPRSEPPPRPAKRPLLEPGQRLLWGNHRAIAAMKQNGWDPRPVAWGQEREEDNGYAVPDLGLFQYNVRVDGHGVGVPLQGLVAIEWTPTRHRREEIHAAILSMGPCLLRTAKGTDSRLYLFRADRKWYEQTIGVPFAQLSIRRAPRQLVVLSGADAAGREYVLDRDILQTRVDELATFDFHDHGRLQNALDAIPEPDYSQPAPRKRKGAAA
jgi:hypothetical protein